MDDGERRRLVFTNLCNGVPVHSLMESLRLSEKDVMRDFNFVVMKLRSYRFERAMPLLFIKTIDDARAVRVEALLTLQKLNLGRDPAYPNIETLPYTVNPGGGMSEAEQAMLHLQLKNGGAKRA